MTIGFYPESLSMPQVWKKPDGSKLMVQGTRHFAENQEPIFGYISFPKSTGSFQPFSVVEELKPVWPKFT